jgi:hypothetical protein
MTLPDESIVTVDDVNSVLATGLIILGIYSS